MVGVPASPNRIVPTVSGIDDLQGALPISIAFQLDITLLVLLQIHEDQCGKFQPSDDDLHRTACIPTTGPWILYVGDGQRIDTEFRCEQVIALTNAFIHPVDHLPLLGAIEDVVRHHLEGRQVATRSTDGIHVRESDTGL